MSTSIDMVSTYITFVVLLMYKVPLQKELIKSSTKRWKASHKIITTGHTKSLLFLGRSLHAAQKLQFYSKYLNPILILYRNLMEAL